MCVCVCVWASVCVRADPLVVYAHLRNFLMESPLGRISLERPAPRRNKRTPPPCRFIHLYSRYHIHTVYRCQQISDYTQVYVLYIRVDLQSVCYVCLTTHKRTHIHTITRIHTHTHTHTHCTVDFCRRGSDPVYVILDLRYVCFYMTLYLLKFCALLSFYSV